MVFKKYRKNIFIIFLFFICVFAMGNETLVIYNGPSDYGDPNKVMILRELLGKFSRDVDVIDAEKYSSGGLHEYQKIFYLGNLEIPPRDEIIEDLSSFKGDVFWLGYGLERFISKDSSLNLKYRGKVSSYSEVSYLVKTSKPYKDRTFPISNNSSRIILEGEGITHHSWFPDGVPYIGQKNRVWFTTIPLEVYGPLFLIFCDLLYDFYQVKEIPEGSIYIRLEDVHPFRDTKKLRAVGDLLYSRNIPFMIALIPAYQATGDKYITEMSEMPEFSETIRYLQSIGGSVVLHGYTHKAFGGELTGEGYEFWDGEKNKPLEEEKVDNIEEWVHERIGKGIKLCLAEGIYPLAFEAPHYAASSNVYKELKKVFSTYVGQIQVSDETFLTIELPYEFYGVEIFNRVLPENLGYVREEDPHFLDKIKNKYDAASIVRGGMQGMFFHPYLNIEYLEKIIANLDEGLNYYDLKKDSHWVNWEGISIRSKEGVIQVDGFVPKRKSHIENSIGEAIKFLVILSLMAFVILALICFVSRKKYLNEIFK